MLKILFISLLFSSFLTVKASETLYKITYRDKTEDTDKVEVYNNSSDLLERIEVIKYSPESYGNLKLSKATKGNVGVGDKGFVALIKRGGEGGGD